MVVDSENTFLSQRRIPRLALISTELSSNELNLTAPGMEKLSIQLHNREGRRMRVKVWDDIVEAIEEERRVSDWISDFLSISATMVRMPDETRRHVQPTYAIGRQYFGFADAFPFLVLSEASLQDLNSRLDQPLPVNRFRPNLVISGCKPFDEDQWKEIKVGPIGLHFAKPCSRCTTTTVDQSTGEVGKEPLRTLATYRQKDGKVYFGQNAIHRNSGQLTVGDRVQVIQADGVF